MNAPLLVAEERGVQRICFNRRERLNAYDLETIQQLLDALERTAERADIGAILLEGNGPFCVGHDFHHFWRLHNRGDVESYRRLQEALRDILLLLPRLPQLVVAVIEGTAAGGGCTLALAADCRVAGPEAALGHPAITFGFPAELGAASWAAWAAGPSLALDMLTTGRMVDATEATLKGLLDLHARPSEAALQLARQAAALSAENRQPLKRSVYRAALPPDSAQLGRELDDRLRFFLSDECTEAIAKLREAGAAPIDG